MPAFLSDSRAPIDGLAEARREASYRYPKKAHSLIGLLSGAERFYIHHFGEAARRGQLRGSIGINPRGGISLIIMLVPLDPSGPAAQLLSVGSIRSSLVRDRSLFSAAELGTRSPASIYVGAPYPSGLRRSTQTVIFRLTPMSSREAHASLLQRVV